MRFPKPVWDQLKNISADELIAALEKDGWIRDAGKGSIIVFRHPDSRRVAIHYHPRKTFGPQLLKALLDDIGWAERELRQMKLIK